MILIVKENVILNSNEVVENEAKKKKKLKMMKSRRPSINIFPK